MADETIGRYEIQGTLGQGAMGMVFKAYDPRLERYAAIKVMIGREVNDDDRSRFFLEARSAARLNHPNIISIYDLGEDEERPFIAMEYMEGHELKELIQNRAFIPFEQKIRFVIEICQGLDYAHQNGVVHRDIKPGNVFIMQNGGLKILDFGVARLVSAEITQGGLILGSPYYMSPEQAKGDPNVDGRSDIFSIGVLLYELIAYKRPFEGETPTSVCFQIVTEAHLPITNLLPGCPSALGTIVDQALAKDRESRYQNCAEMAKDLSEFLENFTQSEPDLREEIEALRVELEKSREEHDDPAIQDLIREELVQPAESESEESSEDFGILLSEHAALKRCSQRIAEKEAKETQLQFNAALAVSRIAMDQQDFDRCLNAVSAALKVDPDQAEALELKRRATLKKKMAKRISKERGSAGPEPQAASEQDPHVAELLEYARSEIAGGSLKSALSSVTFFLEIDPDNPEALELQQQAERTAIERQREAEAVAEAVEDVPVEIEATQLVEDATQVVEDATQVVQADPTAVDTPRAGFQVPAILSNQRVKWLAGGAVVVLLVLVAIRLAGPVADMHVGSLVLNVTPWANVDSITNIDSGEPVPLDGLSTPCVVQLSPGTYRVQVSNPHFEQPLEFEVSVAGGDASIVHETLPSFNLEEELLRVIQAQPGS